MQGDASAYAALGLEPGADPATIDAAYRKPIKLYHSDRPGGDVARAAEINRAYRDLRRRPAPVDAFNFGGDDVQEPSSGAWVRASVGLIISVAALLVATGPGAAWMREMGRPIRNHACSGADCRERAGSRSHGPTARPCSPRQGDCRRGADQPHRRQRRASE